MTNLKISPSQAGLTLMVWNTEKNMHFVGICNSPYTPFFNCILSTPSKCVFLGGNCFREGF